MTITEDKVASSINSFKNVSQEKLVESSTALSGKKIGMKHHTPHPDLKQKVNGQSSTLINYFAIHGQKINALASLQELHRGDDYIL